MSDVSGIFVYFTARAPLAKLLWIKLILQKKMRNFLSGGGSAPTSHC